MRQTRLQSAFSSHTVRRSDQRLFTPKPQAADEMTAEDDDDDDDGDDELDSVFIHVFRVEGGVILGMSE